LVGRKSIGAAPHAPLLPTYGHRRELLLVAVEPVGTEDRDDPGHRLANSIVLTSMASTSAPAKLRCDVAQYRIKDVGAVVHTELIGDSQQQSVGGGDRLILG
jgi:hypothetical protein